MAATVLLSGVSVFAQEAAPKAEAAAVVEVKACPLTLSADLGLSKEQADKVAAAKAECDKAGVTKESCEAHVKALKEILTAEQVAKCKADCEKAGNKNCPFAEAAK
jgi:hypothetical protein